MTKSVCPLQLFRTVNAPLNPLSSYYLKTVVMHMIIENPRMEWEASKMPDLFIEAKTISY